MEALQLFSNMSERSGNPSCMPEIDRWERFPGTMRVLCDINARHEERERVRVLMLTARGRAQLALEALKRREAEARERNKVQGKGGASDVSRAATMRRLDAVRRDALRKKLDQAQQGRGGTSSGKKGK